MCFVGFTLTCDCCFLPVGLFLLFFFWGGECYFYFIFIFRGFFILFYSVSLKFLFSTKLDRTRSTHTCRCTSPYCWTHTWTQVWYIHTNKKTLLRVQSTHINYSESKWSEKEREANTRGITRDSLCCFLFVLFLLFVSFFRSFWGGESCLLFVFLVGWFFSFSFFLHFLHCLWFSVCPTVFPYLW